MARIGEEKCHGLDWRAEKQVISDWAAVFAEVVDRHQMISEKQKTLRRCLKRGLQGTESNLETNRCCDRN